MENAWLLVFSRSGFAKRVGGRFEGSSVGQARRIVYDRNEWRGFVRGNSWSIARGINPEI